MTDGVTDIEALVAERNGLAKERVQLKRDLQHVTTALSQIRLAIIRGRPLSVVRGKGIIDHDADRGGVPLPNNDAIMGAQNRLLRVDKRLQEIGRALAGVGS